MVLNISFSYIVFYYSFLILATFINIELTDRQYRSLNIMFLLAVISLAYNFTPSSSLDLYRYYEMLEKYKNMDWSQSIKFGNYNNTLITNFYFYIMSRIFNRKLFSAIPTGITFAIILYVSSKFRKKYNSTFREYSFFILGIISVASLIGIISGIRQNLSWALLMLAVYYDFYNGNSNVIVKLTLYILPPLVHLSSVPLIVIRFIVLLTKKFNFLNYLIVLWPLVINAINVFYFALPPILQNAFERLLFHTSYEGVTITYKRLFAIIGYLIFFYIALNIKKQSFEKKLFFTHNEFHKYYLTVILFGISSIFVDFILFGRLMEFVIYISLPLIYDLYRSKFMFRKISIMLLVILYILLFCLQDVIPGFFIEV